MSYVESNLSENEEIYYIGSIHWVFMVLGVISLIILIYCSTLPYFSETMNPIISILILLICFGVGYFDQYKSVEMVITNKRLIYKQGLIIKKSLELNLDQIESVDLKRDPVGQILGWGQIVVNGTGGTKQTLHQFLDNPEEFRQKIQDKQSSS